MEFVPNTLDLHQPPWRNWLARSAVNRKVGGSSPPGGASFGSKAIFHDWSTFGRGTSNQVSLV